MRRDVTSVPPSMHGTQNVNINVALVVAGTKLRTIVPHAQELDGDWNFQLSRAMHKRCQMWSVPFPKSPKRRKVCLHSGIQKTSHGLRHQKDFHS